jgi:multisubunit Na+/H+ antiporter MnhB subunit
MVTAAVLTVAIGSKKQKRPVTTKSRAIGAIWTAVGSALFLYCFSVGVSGHFESHAYMAAIETMLGLANCASAIVLRWRAQFLVTLVWWVSAAATCFVSETLVLPILVAASLIGNIGFGLYLMVREHGDQRKKMQHA